VQMRGLYHQRSGNAKPPEYTGWPIEADHTSTYRGGFPSDIAHYDKAGGCFTDPNGDPVQVNHFAAVAGSATDEELPDVYGGWWDAGDFDRRPFHFNTVDALLSVYLLFPEKFSDGQLDLPESGNGIPDIVDEAAWGVEVWRRAQRKNGSVGCWIEATTHPKVSDPAVDPQRYYAALPTRESSLQYATYAAKLARAYRRAGSEDKAKLYSESEIRAWDFAIDPANRAEADLTVWGKPLHYREPEQLRREMVFKAALNLYLLTGEDRFKNAALDIDFKTVLAYVLDKGAAYYLSELLETDDPMFLIPGGRYRKAVRERADWLIDCSRKEAYRNAHWPPGNAWFLSLSWGEAIPLKKGAYLIMAYRITGAKKYRDNALLQADWLYGANPMGRSLTTGLGSVYPVRLLSLPFQAYTDKWTEPFPGITPFTFTGQNQFATGRMIFRYAFEPRPDHQFAGCEVNLLPKSLGGGEKLSQRECWNRLGAFIPVWRRYANLENEAVDQDEFTVWETMGPVAAACAALLPEGWRPPPEWKHQKPHERLEDIPGYIFLP